MSSSSNFKSKAKAKGAVWDFYGKTIRVHGDTYPIKQDLKDLGGSFKQNYGGVPAWVFFKEKDEAEDVINNKLLKSFKKLNIKQSEVKKVEPGLTTSHTFTYPKLVKGDKLEMKFIKNGEEKIRMYRVWNVEKSYDIDIVSEEDYETAQSTDESPEGVYNIGIFNGNFRFEFFAYEHSFKIILQRETKVDSSRKNTKKKVVEEAPDSNSD